MKEKQNNYDQFCLFRIPEKGGRAIWEITNSCNYSCGYCIFAAMKGKIEGELTTEEAFKVLQGLKEQNFSHIKFTGGEPFIRKDFVDILEKATNMGFQVDVSTNGSVINTSIAKRIKKYNLEMIHVSVDGPNKEIHEAARGPNTYTRTIQGIKTLTKEGINVRIGTVIFKDNQERLEEMVQSAVELGANEIIFSFMESIGRMEGDNSKISDKEISEVKKELEDISRKYYDKIKVNYSFTEKPKSCEKGICPGGKDFLYIDNFGRTSPCTWIVDKHPEYRCNKTIRDTIFENIINSTPIQEYRAYVESKEGLGCPACRRT